MIKYIIQAKKHNFNESKEVKYYPQIAPSTPMKFAQITKRSMVSSADVKAVLDALQYEVIEALQNGNIVRLGDLGSFHLTIKADGTATASEAKSKGADLVKAVNVQFVKSTAIREAFVLLAFDFAAQADIVNAAD